MSKFRLKRRMKDMQERFVLDGNIRDFQPQPYQPIFDKHLFFFFANQSKLKHLYRQHIVNRKFEIVDPKLKRIVRARGKSQQHNRKTLHDTLLGLRDKGNLMQQKGRQRKSFRLKQGRSKKNKQIETIN